MRVRTFEPSARLRPFLRRFELIETEAEATRTLVPDTGLVLGFRYRGAATLLEGARARRLPDCSVTGLRATARTIRTSAGGGMLVAKFHAAGAAAFLAAPLQDLFGATLALDDLLPRAQVERASARIAEARDAAGRIAACEDFLLSLRREHLPDPRVAGAVQAILAGRGSLRVRSLAHALGLGQDAFEKRFRREVGTAPKRFSSIVRLRHAVASYRSGVTMAALSHAAEYFDQSHFVRDFRAAFGQAPGYFLRSSEYC